MLPIRRTQAMLAAVVLVVLFFVLHSSHSETASSLTWPSKSSPASALRQFNPDSGADLTGAAPPDALIQPDTQTSLAEPASGVRKQASLAELADRPLRQKLALRFPYHIEDKFPAYIWQTWRTTPGSGEFPEDWRALEASWSELHRGFVHEVIDDASAMHVIRHLYSGIPEPVAAYEALEKPVLKADFFRYLILLARGGIYSDIDTRAIKSASEWVPETVPRSTYGLVVGIEADPDRDDWADWYARRIQFCQWTIQAKIGHPVLLEIVAHITEEALARHRDRSSKKSAGKADGVMDFTGPGVWTDIIFKYLNDPRYFDMEQSLGNITWEHFTGMRAAKKVGDVIVLPITSFSPGVGQMNAGDDDDPMAFVHHNFEGSWKPESERHIGSR